MDLFTFLANEPCSVNFGVPGEQREQFMLEEQRRCVRWLLSLISAQGSLRPGADPSEVDHNLLNNHFTTEKPIMLGHICFFLLLDKFCMARADI